MLWLRIFFLQTPDDKFFPDKRRCKIFSRIISHTYFFGVGNSFPQVFPCKNFFPSKSFCQIFFSEVTYTPLPPPSNGRPLRTKFCTCDWSPGHCQSCTFLSLLSVHLYNKIVFIVFRNKQSCIKREGKPTPPPPPPPPPRPDAARQNRHTTKRREKLKGGTKVKMSEEELWRQRHNVLRD